MNALVIGHRGVGKTSFLERVRAYLGPGVATRDLDAEVEAMAGLSVAEIFAQKGEAEFRRMERAALARLALAPGPLWVAAGAGFDGEPPAGWRALWLSRPSDAAGRVFPDRPRLDPGVSPLDEFLERKRARDERFARLATDRLEIDEGFDFPNAEERAFVRAELRAVGGAVTALRGDAAELRRLAAFGPAWVELRDDLLSAERLDGAFATLPAQQILLSVRRSGSSVPALASARGAAWDWPAELGAPAAAPTILSVHERAAGESLADLLARADGLGAHAQIVKAAPMVESFAELALGEAWRAQDPARRAFLPRSRDGRWAWYRLLRKKDQPLGFWREGPGSALDQPPLLRWARAQGPRPFLAVLGHPVAHSRTPAEQSAFAREHGLDAFAIDVRPEEWGEALRLLRALGLRFAAVTAPLKELAGSAESPVNTLALLPDGTEAKTNTDLEGLRRAWATAGGEGEIAIWGGGGTLAIMQAALPPARPYSARTGRPRNGGEPANPDCVVWAVGRSRMNGGAQETAQESAQWPPASWTPRLVFDMNYAEDSPGREYALRTGARYVSGLAMFRAQAEAQRAFWRTHVGP